MRVSLFEMPGTRHRSVRSEHGSDWMARHDASNASITGELIRATDRFGSTRSSGIVLTPS